MLSPHVVVMRPLLPAPPSHSYPCFPPSPAWLIRFVPPCFAYPPCDIPPYPTTLLPLSLRSTLPTAQSARLRDTYPCDTLLLHPTPPFRTAATAQVPVLYSAPRAYCLYYFISTRDAVAHRCAMCCAPIMLCTRRRTRQAAAHDDVFSLLLYVLCMLSPRTHC